MKEKEEEGKERKRWRYIILTKHDLANWFSWIPVYLLRPQTPSA